jgi:hypothetical protein
MIQLDDGSRRQRRGPSGGEGELANAEVIQTAKDANHANGELSRRDKIIQPSVAVTQERLRWVKTPQGYQL